MNVVDLVEAARPEVAPMPLADRRMVRERLFGAADDVVKTTIRERSSSGAVTSTAPPGYRASRVKARPKRPRSNGSFAKMGAGLLVVGAAAAAGWSWYADGDDGENAAVETTAVTTSTTSTTVAAATTTLAPTRTGVSPDEPVVFPLGLVPVEEAVIDLAPTSGEFVLFRAADATWLRLDVLDGNAFDPGPLQFETIGSTDVGPFAFGAGAPWIYTVRTTCGIVRLIDAPEQEQFRPTVLEFFEGLSVDNGGSVDALLPEGLRIVEAAVGEREYRTVFRFEGDDGDGDLVTLRQVPNGSIAQLIPGGAQPSEMVWLGEPALGEGDLTADEQNGPVAVYWRDAATVFAISSETVGIDQLETFVSGLRAASTGDWTDRFSASEVDTTATLGTAPPDDGGGDDEPAPTTEPPCSPQPALGPTFRP